MWDYLVDCSLLTGTFVGIHADCFNEQTDTYHHEISGVKSRFCQTSILKLLTIMSKLDTFHLMFIDNDDITSYNLKLVVDRI